MIGYPDVGSIFIATSLHPDDPARTLAFSVTIDVWALEFASRRGVWYGYGHEGSPCSGSDGTKMQKIQLKITAAEIASPFPVSKSACAGRRWTQTPLGSSITRDILHFEPSSPQGHTLELGS